MGMPCQDLHRGIRLCFLRLPDPDTSIGAATGKKCSIGAPRKRIDAPSLADAGLDVPPSEGIPELNQGITPATGEEVSIRSKGHCIKTSRVSAYPPQAASADLPELHLAIHPSDSDQRAFIWAKSELRRTPN